MINESMFTYIYTVDSYILNTRNKNLHKLVRYKFCRF